MNKDRDPEVIKSMIRRKGRTLAGLAGAKNVSRHRLCRAMTRPDEVGEHIIATALGENPRFIWPSRYNDSGRRYKPQPSENYRPHSRFRRGGGQK